MKKQNENQQEVKTQEAAKSEILNNLSQLDVSELGEEEELQVSGGTWCADNADWGVSQIS